MIQAILTIDDIASQNTPAIVDYLNGRGIRPILFAVGMNLEKYWEEGVYAVRHGMIVGNHSDSHPHFSSLTAEEAVREIEACEDRLNALYRAAGVARRYRPFRFPYGDQGGEHKAALQLYLREHGFHKVRDDQIPYPWWKEIGKDRDIDTFWTYDFQEYCLRPGSNFTQESIWRKMHDAHPGSGAPLLMENARHILLLHAHDETDALMPGYYRLMIDHLLENGVQFEAPAFLESKQERSE